jgi:osmotically-inducible protein OsmY
MKSDGELERDVAAALSGMTATGMRDVAIAASSGIVTLRGEVVTFEERAHAERAANRVPGVTAVVNEIVATQDPTTVGLDTITATEAVAAINATPALAGAVAVSVVDGVATLSGVVVDESERDAAREAVAAIPGVRTVVNRIRTAGPSDARAVERRIAFAFDVNGMPGADRVRVDVGDHMARLSGTLDSQAERDEAVAAAEATPGITAVDDQLTAP